MNYQQTLQKLESKKSKRKNPSLENTQKALNRLDNPQQDYNVILVGGTNGKGSTSEIIAEILSSQGEDVGIFKSPHLKSVRERIKFDGEKISEKELSQMYRKLENLGISLSFFKFLTVAAYNYFSEKNVDYAVMEVGMGGKLDATNAADSKLSVITNIEKEHTEHLGNTREKIAGEIAGITPEKGKLVTSSNLKTIKATAENRETEIIKPFNVAKKNRKYVFGDQEFEIPVEGSYQKENLETALTVVDELEKVPENIEDSLSNLKCPGRMEKVSKKPEIILDGAHNPAAIQKLMKDLSKDFICVFGCTNSKDYKKMIEELEEKASKFYFTKPDIGWAEEPEKLSEVSDANTSVYENNVKALERAIEGNNNEQIVVTGSLYLIGNIKQKTGF